MKQSDRLIPLGYELGTGEQVSIPIRNLCITGQTQEAGKTTALEALVARSEMRAVAFVTKRHESGFANARRIAPYFRERADWQFVASILEATLRQQLRFQRSWIMKLCEYQPPKAARSKRGISASGWNVPHSLADVLANVEIALQTATGIHEGVFTELRGYLKMVVPQIERLPYSTSLSLAPGLNVMNLVEYSTELQSLVIRSVLEWIYEQESETITVIPEAWEFIPQKRGSPVKLAAEALIRKGSAGRNYIWLDSQDLANVDKDIVRSCPVMLLGVQREANEVKRTIAHIPDTVHVKPKPRDIQTLGLGEFIVCYGKTIKRVYVQPAWLSSAEAREIACGNLGAEEAAARRKPKTKAAATTISDEEEAMYKAKFEAEKERADDLQRQIANLNREMEELRQTRQAEHVPAGESLMRHATGRPLEESRSPMPPPNINGDADAIYDYIVQRLRSEPPPVLLQLLRSSPEIEVETTREKIRVDESSVKGRIAELIAEGFFDSRKQAGDAHKRMLEAGFTVTRPAVNQALDDLTLMRFFTRESDSSRRVYYKAVAGMKVNVVER